MSTVRLCDACGRPLERDQERFCSDMCRVTHFEVLGSRNPTFDLEGRPDPQSEYDGELVIDDDTSADGFSVVDSSELNETDEPDDDFDEEFEDELIDLDDEYAEGDGEDPVRAPTTVPESSRPEGIVPYSKVLSNPGEWVEVRGERYGEAVNFRARAVGLVQTSALEISSENADMRVEGSLWRLSLEVVNTGRVAMGAYLVERSLILLDHDACEFPAASELWLTHDQDHPLHRFKDSSACPPLLPKVVARGDVAFVLPEEDGRYRLAVGTLE